MAETNSVWYLIIGGALVLLGLACLWLGTSLYLDDKGE